MKVKEVLRKLDLGNSVAEFDEALDAYFIETETFRSLIRDRGDIIAGDKGTGKTAMFRILRGRYAGIAELAKVEVITGFNPEGSPIFERLAGGKALDEGQYITIWKAYLVSLVGNWLLDIYEGALTDRMKELDDLLQRVDLRTSDDKPSTIFNRIVNLYRRLTDPKSAEFAFALTPEGIPVITGRIEFGEGGDTSRSTNTIPHRDALSLVNQLLEESDLYAWIVLDRLDEAFQAYPEIEVPALRGLLRTYLDLAEFDRFRLKLFLRNDLFRRIIAGGFVNLTHVNARKIEIIWDDEDLFNLLGRRIAENPDFLTDTGLSADASADSLFNAVFPPQVDVGDRRPTTSRWMISRVRDGNDVKAPRNLIDLVQKAQDAQLRREERENNDYEVGRPLIQPDAIKRGLKALSEARVQDTLLAEADEDLAVKIGRFRDRKAEHNEVSLSEVLGLEGDNLAAAIRALLQIGFLEQVGSSFKIPMLYRDGLNITQGKAF
jgi:hypothetical protein